MRAVEKRSVWLAVVCVVATGFGYGWLLWFGEGEDEFGPVAHPWLSTLQAWHVVTAPLFVFAVGVLWPQHIVLKLRTGAKPRRRTGIVLLSQALPMLFSGYLLQVSVDETWRQVWTVTHVATSVLFTVVFVLHLVAGKRRAAGRLRPART